MNHALRISLSAASLIAAIFVSCAHAKDSPIVDFSDQSGDFSLISAGKAADIYVDPHDAQVVGIAAADFAQDIQRVSGILPTVKTSTADLGENAVIIGTIGQCPVIDQLGRDKKIFLTRTARSWETYLIVAVDDPLPGVKHALIIAGSDRRGTAYGVFEMSKQIGVSPWVWWADVTPAHHDELFVRGEMSSDGPPSVKYRGIFINDEDWGMHPWASKTFEPDYGDMGPKTYAKIFELLLRLKANTMWPAMHPGSKEFNVNPQNRVVADQYAIVMGSSHCEPLLQNNVHWNVKTQGPWSYVTNQAGLDAYWQQRLDENGKYENLYTIGMRGIHDAPMPDGKTVDEKKEILQRVIADQRGMLARTLNLSITSIPQIFIPYKEVLTVYQDGLQVPDDVTLVWVDDNHGYIRQLSNPDEQKRAGGAGVYYHVSYWGAPHDYLWICSTPPALIGEEMSKAYDYGAQTFWILNVGDLKPAEIDIDYFLQLAWNSGNWTPAGTHQWLRDWSAQQFGPDSADGIADVLSEYYKLNDERKPEHMGWNVESRPIQPSELSAINYGDEQQQRLDDYDRIVAQADQIGSKLPANQADAYYELVQYPVRAAALMNHKILDAQLSLLYATQGRASAVDYANQAHQAFDQIHAETAWYNNLAGGKWKNMMSDDPHPQSVFAMPTVADATSPAAGGLGLAIEGQEAAIGSGGADALPTFDAFTAQKHFVDLFDIGTNPIAWTAAASAPWIQIDKTSGTQTGDARLWISADFSKAPIGDDDTGQIIFKSGDQTKTVNIHLFNPQSPRPADLKGTFVESDGVVSMLAEHFTSASNSGWTRVPGLGRFDSAVLFLPTTAPTIDPPTSASSKLQFDMQIFHPGPATVWVQALPTHHVYRDGKLRYGISIDDSPIQLIDLQADPDTRQTAAAWSLNVLRAAAIGQSKFTLATPGKHTLSIYYVDPGVALDKIVVDLGGLRPSYLGPPETICQNP
jgi:hypothetical protein